MIAEIIKKQALLFLRNPVQLLLLCGLPIILITILGTALGSWMNGDVIEIKFKLAVIEKEAESEQVGRFINELENRNLPEEAIADMTAAAESAQPIQTLLEVLQTEELGEMITIENAESDDFSRITADNTYAVILEIPSGFSYDILNRLFFNEEVYPELTIYHNEGSEIAGNIIGQIVTAYQEEYTLGSFLGEKGINPEQLTEMAAGFTQERTAINQNNPVSAKAYYTIGMVVMNVLFMAGTLATFAFQEKQLYIFDRIILADISRWTYFVGILLTGTIFAFIQSVFVFAFAYFVFGVEWPDLSAFFGITAFFSISVGGLSVLLTAISYRTNSEQIISFFSGIIVTIFAFLGGSFFPIGESSSLMQKIGDFTPNGAAMSAYLSIIRGESMMDNLEHLIFICCFAMIAIIIGVLSFPKRGAAS